MVSENASLPVEENKVFNREKLSKNVQIIEFLLKKKIDNFAKNNINIFDKKTRSESLDIIARLSHKSDDLQKCVDALVGCIVDIEKIIGE